MLKKLVIVCGDLESIDARVAVLLSQCSHPTLVQHPGALARGREQVEIFRKILREASQDLTQTELIVSTNSEPIVCHLGELVEQKLVQRELVTVERAERDKQVVSTDFDEQGILNDWEIGYLSSWN